VRYRAITPPEFADALAPMLGAMAEPIADDYRVIVERADALGIHDDTEAGLAALGARLTPVAEWARAQDWHAAAAGAAA
jgi:hypothetical protein